MIDVGRLPREIRESTRAVVWKWEQRNGKRTKPPYAAFATEEKASATDARTWASFTEALDAFHDGKSDGVGIVLGDGLAGVDLDDCRNPETGEIAEWALAIVRRTNSYTEISPSGRGVKIFVRGILPHGGRNRKGSIEIYDHDRYFTVTASHLAGTPTTIEERTSELAALHAEMFGKNGGRPESPRRETSTPSFDDAELLERARNASNGAKFSALWSGDTSGYPSHSEADQALCNLLAFWVGPDPARMDRLFRASGLYREKWERDDYREKTIARSLEGCRETYNPRKQPSSREPAEQSKAADPVVELHPTDLGNARRLVAMHGRRLRFCHPWNRWLVWDGRRWNVDDTAAVVTFAKETALSIYAEAATESNEDRRKQLAKHAITSERAERLAAMVKLATSEPGVPVLPDDLDRDPWLLNLENGRLDLRSGELRPHDPAELLTKLAPVHFRSEAHCPLFFSFLDRIMAGRLPLIEFLQRTFGYALTGTTRERCLWIFWGGGDNGKSTLLETIGAVLGDYAATTPPRTLMAKRDDGVPNDVARLKGSRFVAAVETAESRRLDVELVKRMTGGIDKLSARFMRGEWFDFQPSFKLFLATNHKPVVKDTTESIWRRIKLVPFTVSIPEHEQDKTLPEKLRAELPGVLNWLLDGCLAWQREGLGVPPEVASATASYRSEMDSLAQFFDDACVTDPKAWVMSADLYKEYRDWCEANGEQPLTQTKLGTALAEKGLDRKRATDGRVQWFGVGLKAPQPKGLKS